MNKKPTDRLEKELRNIGPVMARRLVKAGIETPEKLRKLGAKKAFLKICDTGGFCSRYNSAYLYALEGAIRECDWREIPEQLKREYKEFTSALREGR